MSASTFPVAAEGSLVEGLLRAVTLAPELVQDLNRIGVDPHRLESRYRVDTWARAIEVVRSHVYPTLSLEEGNRRLGFDFSHGFSTTIGGRLVLAVVPFLKPATLLARMPRFFKLGRADLVASWVQRSANSGTLRIVDQAQVSPSFDIGLIQYILERVGAKATTTVEWHSLTEFSIHYTW